MAIYAAAHGLPFMPTYPLEGTGIFQHRTILGPDKVRVIDSPFSGEKVCLVKPLAPKSVWSMFNGGPGRECPGLGTLGDIRGTANAGKKVIVSAEEIVDPSIILKEPFKTILPGFRVTAVVHEPWARIHRMYSSITTGTYGSRRRTRKPPKPWRVPEVLDEWCTGGGPD